MLTAKARPEQPPARVESQPSGWAIRRVDVAVYVLVITIGILGLFFYRHSDFYFDDVGDVGRGLALLRYRLDRFNGTPELVQPPGLAIIIALIAALVGSTYAVFLRAMAICCMLGLLATYELLRREESRKLAAAVCLLLASSPIYFSMATTGVYDAYPYMLAAVLVLIAARNADASARGRSRVLWATVTALVTVAAVMIASRGVALLGGMFAWMSVSFVTDRHCAVERLKTFLPALILGAAVQGWWMSHAPSSSDWPLPGYPASYISQLKLKLGNFPELGMASPVDLVSRMGRNLQSGAAALSELLSHHWINPSWSSLAIVGMIVLVFLGIGSSLWRPGHRLMDWYFLGTGCVFVLWSWSFEMRFFLPGAAFAAVYAWRGVHAVRRISTRKPRLTGAVGLAFSVLLGTHASLWAMGLRTGGGLAGGLEAKLSALGWLAVAVASAWMLWKGTPPRLPRPRIATMGAVLLPSLVAVGIFQDIRVGWHNTHLSNDLLNPPDVAGAKWIKAHTPADAVVLARHNYIVSYYSQRKTYWYPPISKPAVLLDGIRRRGVNYVLVVNRENPYYLPSDLDCFEPLLKSYSEAVRLVESGQKFSVYEVLAEQR